MLQFEGICCFLCYSLQQLVSYLKMQMSSTQSSIEFGQNQQQMTVISSDGPFMITCPTSHQRINPTRLSEWTTEENAKFLIFCKGNLQLLLSLQIEWKFFKKMSQFVKSRNYRQCRMHYDKLKKKYGNLDDIARELCEEYPSLSNQLTLHQPSFKEQKHRFNIDQNPKQADIFRTSDAYEVESDQLDGGIGAQLKNIPPNSVEKQQTIKVPTKSNPGFFQQWMKKYEKMMKVTQR